MRIYKFKLAFAISFSLIFIQSIEPALIDLTGRKWVIKNTYIQDDIISFSTVAGAFMHIDTTHLFRNIVTILITIPIVRSLYSVGYTVLIFVTSAIFGSLVYIISSEIFETYVATRGSSGATFALIGISWCIICRDTKLPHSIKSALPLGFVIVFAYEILTIIIEQSFFPDNPAVSVVHITSFLLGIYIPLMTESKGTSTKIRNLSGFLAYGLKSLFRIAR